MAIPAATFKAPISVIKAFLPLFIFFATKSSELSKIPTLVSTSHQRLLPSFGHPERLFQLQLPLSQPSMEHPNAGKKPGYQSRTVPQYRTSPSYAGPNSYSRTTSQYYTVPCQPMMADLPVRENPRTTKVPAAKIPNAEATLKVLQIPCDGSHMKLISVPLLVISPEIVESNHSDGLESHLRHVPKLCNKGAMSFEWHSRSLDTMSAAQLGPNWKEDYFMYKCNDSKAGLKANAFFARVHGARVYGDAFVFRMEPDTYDGFTGRAEYVDMDHGFAKQTGAMELLDNLAVL